uniref:Uncharacterized protein n=1 Tax=Eutreptiella gymnastica TaxID=73025 RepID=A0A7S4FXX9_9EUGL
MHLCHLVYSYYNYTTLMPTKCVAKLWQRAGLQSAPANQAQITASIVIKVRRPLFSTWPCLCEIACCNVSDLKMCRVTKNTCVHTQTRRRETNCGSMHVHMHTNN